MPTSASISIQEYLSTSYARPGNAGWETVERREPEAEVLEVAGAPIRILLNELFADLA